MRNLWRFMLYFVEILGRTNPWLFIRDTHLHKDQVPTMITKGNLQLANYLWYDTLASMESSQYLMPHMPTCMGWFCGYDFVFLSRQNLTNHLKYLSKLWMRVRHNNVPHVVLYLKLILDKFHSSIAHEKSASVMINARWKCTPTFEAHVV